MAGREWKFLLDENTEPQVESFMASEGYDAEHVQDALAKGARDKPDVLPYARETDRIIITSDVKDFGGLDPSNHPGVMLLYEQRVSGTKSPTPLSTSSTPTAIGSGSSPSRSMSGCSYNHSTFPLALRCAAGEHAPL
jgi:hypothetical protein